MAIKAGRRKVDSGEARGNIGRPVLVVAPAERLTARGNSANVHSTSIELRPDLPRGNVGDLACLVISPAVRHTAAIRRGEEDAKGGIGRGRRGRKRGEWKDEMTVRSIGGHSTVDTHTNTHTHIHTQMHKHIHTHVPRCKTAREGIVCTFRHGNTPRGDGLPRLASGHSGDPVCAATRSPAPADTTRRDAAGVLKTSMDLIPALARRYRGDFARDVLSPAMPVSAVERANNLSVSLVLSCECPSRARGAAKRRTCAPAVVSLLGSALLETNLIVTPQL